jgi:polyhydroxybutyrate depolymerase
VRTAIVLALVAALGVLGCSRKKKVDPTVAPVQGESTVLPRITRGAPGPTRVEPTRIEGRPVVLVQPVTIDPTKKLPLVVIFHGDGGDAESMHYHWPWEKVLGDVAVFAYADARHPLSWDLETPRDNKDVAYVVSLVDAIASRLPIDRTRVFMSGYSNGGFFANVVACQRSDLVRAIASNAGGAPYNQAERWPNGFPKCPGQKAVAAMALHGRRDFGVTLDSGRFSAEYWAAVDGCNVAEMETTGYIECLSYRGCPAGKNVVWCEVPDLGHWVWDHAAEASWTFFERQ